MQAGLPDPVGGIVNDTIAALERRMRFALLGDAPAARAIARAVASSPGQTLAGAVALPQSFAALASFAPRARQFSRWEEFLTGDIDALIVAGDDEETLRGARQLAEAGKALLIVPAAGQTSTFFYEMSLLQAEQSVRLFPAFLRRRHPLVSKLRELAAGETLGPLRHLQLERMIAPAVETSPSAGLSTRELGDAFLCDADLISSLCGPYDQVTAVRSGDDIRGYSLATVTLAGSGVPQAVWSAVAGTGESTWRMTLAGERGTAVLAGDPEAGALSLSVDVAGSPTERETVVDDGARWVLEAFLVEVAATGQSGTTTTTRLARPGQTESRPLLAWEDFARVVELLEAVERSVRRRRTIELHHEAPSERGQFKTTMTAAGCSLLVLTLLAVVAYLVVAATLDLPPLVKRILVGLIFLPLGLFLALQALLFIARPAAGPGNGKDETVVR